MKPFYPIRGRLAYYSPQRVDEKRISWPEEPHVYFANLMLDWRSLLAFDRRYGALLAEHWQMTQELKGILLKAPNLTQEERQKWAASNQKFEIAVSESDVQLATAMQSLLRQAWKGEELALELMEHGDVLHAQQEAFGPPRLTVAPSKPGVIVHAKDLWSFIRTAFLLDHVAGRTRVCKNPSCPSPFFLATRKDNRICGQVECSAWAQRKWALEWWNSKGATKRAERQRHARKRRQNTSEQKRRTKP